jgi:ferredoxin
MENTNRPNLIERLRGWLGFYRIGQEDEMRLACQTKVEGDIEVETHPSFNWFGHARK